MVQVDLHWPWPYFSLGAPHDPTVEPCGDAYKYIMAPYVAYASPSSTNTDLWYFSTCSIDSFADYVNGLG